MTSAQINAQIAAERAFEAMRPGIELAAFILVVGLAGLAIIAAIAGTE